MQAQVINGQVSEVMATLTSFCSLPSPNYSPSSNRGYVPCIYTLKGYLQKDQVYLDKSI